MSQLFNRVARVTIGSKGERGVLIEGLRIKFRVEQTSEAGANKARVEIYNLSRATRQAVERTGNYMILQAGYEGSVGRIFEGDIPEGGVLTSRTGADIITTFEAGDGLKRINESVIGQSFKPGTNIKDVVGSLTSAFGLTQGVTEGLEDETYLGGMSVSGRTGDVLSSVLGKQKLRWNIQDGVLNIYPEGGSIGGTAVVLNASSGLIGTPIRKDKGVEITSLLQAKLRPGRLVILDSVNLKGRFVVEKIIHEGDTFATEFYSKIEVEVFK